MVIEYDANVGMLLTAVRYQGTVLPEVFSRLEFWLLLAFHIGVCIAFRTGWLEREDPDFGHDSDIMSIHWTDIKVVTSMTTFFEVFYSNQCFSRYQTLHMLSRRCIGLAFE